MASAARYCRECRAVTSHVVVSAKDLEAYLCNECLWRRAIQPGVEEITVEGSTSLQRKRRNPGATSARRSQAKVKGRRL